MRTQTVDPEFAAFVRGRQQSLLYGAILMTGDRQTAEDLLQEALIKLAERWDKVGRGAETAYVRRTMYHDSISRWRKYGREHAHADPAEAAGAVAQLSHDPIGQWEAGAHVRQALQELPPRQRAVVVLRYYEDLSEEQIADVLGIAPGTVKSQASAAMAKLRGLLPTQPPAGVTREDQR